MSTLAHTLHAVLARTWLGGVAFTTFVVSPAFQAMGWDGAERVLVRFRIGKQYAKVGGANLALLAVFAPFDGIFGGFVRISMLSTRSSPGWPAWSRGTERTLGGGSRRRPQRSRMRRMPTRLRPSPVGAGVSRSSRSVRPSSTCFSARRSRSSPSLRDALPRWTPYESGW